jgi:hypothetical protein
MQRDLLNYINNTILKQASKLRYIVKDTAPSDEKALFSSTSLVIWNGASENTIFQDATVNYAFRALHDSLHLKTGIGFSPLEEIHLGKLQASKFDGILADLIHCEVSLQAEYYLKNGVFVSNQVDFTKKVLKF